jgi:hypothetical protein
MRVERIWERRSAWIDGSMRPKPRTYTDVVVLDGRDRALHTESHRPGWCDGLDDEQFFAALYEHCLQDAGFGFVMSKPKGTVITRAADRGRVDELMRAIRSCEA